MVDVYSPALVVALVSASAAFVAALVSRLRPLAPPFGTPAGWFGLARWSALTAVVALFVAVASHLALGHRPGSEMALGPLEFLAIHPIVPALAAALIVSWLVAAGRDRTPRDTKARVDGRDA